MTGLLPPPRKTASLSELARSHANQERVRFFTAGVASLGERAGHHRPGLVSGFMTQGQFNKDPL